MNDFDELARDLAGAGILAGVKGLAAMEEVTTEIEASARRFASGMKALPHYPKSITHDVRLVDGAIEGEVGPDKNLEQGALGNLIEYGSANNAPFSHLGPALDLHGPAFEEKAADIAERSAIGSIVRFL